VTELIYDLIIRQFLCGKSPEPVKIQYLHPERLYVRNPALMYQTDSRVGSERERNTRLISGNPVRRVHPPVR